MNSRDNLRQQLQEDVETFLKNGGQIVEVPIELRSSNRITKGMTQHEIDDVLEDVGD